MHFLGNLTVLVLCYGALQAAPYRQDEVVLIVASSHALAGSATVDREALAGLPFVSLHRSSTVAAIRAELEAHGIDWQHLRVIMARPARHHFATGRQAVGSGITLSNA